MDVRAELEVGLDKGELGATIKLLEEVDNKFWFELFRDTDDALKDVDASVDIG